MSSQTRFAVVGMVLLLLGFLTLPLVALFARAAGLPGWTYGELMIGNAALARAWALMPAWLLAGVVALSAVPLLAALSTRPTRAKA
jgi:hypothetical protein